MDNLTKTVARAICKASGRCKYIGPKCNTGRCDVSPEQAQAAIRAVLDGIREPDEAMKGVGHQKALAYLDRFGGQSARDVGSVYTAMIDELREKLDD